MSDKEFLIWLHKRLTEIHGEDELMDYMHKLRAIISTTPDDKFTTNTYTGNSLESCLNHHRKPLTRVSYKSGIINVET